jgi:hypothetical protein
MVSQLRGVGRVQTRLEELFPPVRCREAFSLAEDRHGDGGNRNGRASVSDRWVMRRELRAQGSR